MTPEYELDKLMKQHGHDVLRLAPYSPEFNPIEKIWRITKNWVAANNTIFKLNDLEMLTRKKFDKIGQETWYRTC